MDLILKEAFKKRMESPYSPLFSNTVDRVIVWTGVLLVIGVSGIVGMGRGNSRLENCYTSMSVVFFILCASVLFLFATGAVGAMLKINSFLWTFWELIFLLSVVAVFQVFPILSIMLLVWGLVGKVWHSYPLRPLIISAFAAAIAGIDCGLYFLVQKLMK